jgi:uncharacterized lipoprotein NlpE involved in copper resistance
MKKNLWLLILLMLVMIGCNNSSNSGGGSSEPAGFMAGYWSGQWSAEVEAGQNTITISGGPVRVTLQQNGRQLTGTVDQTNLLGDQPGYFSATLSNANGSGNVEVGAMYNSTTSISFHGTYNRSQIYCIFGSSSSTESVVKGNFTITR